jgi:hypothetical protein
MSRCSNSQKAGLLDHLVGGGGGTVMPGHQLRPLVWARRAPRVRRLRDGGAGQVGAGRARDRRQARIGKPPLDQAA